MSQITEAYLQYGTAPGPFLTRAVEFKETETPRFYSASGYGSRIPTRYMVREYGRWRRVYAVCWSNVASYYIGGRDGQPKISVQFYS